MKSQIALIGVGILVASGVAYAELKPATSDPITNVISSPTPVSAVSAAPIATPSKEATSKIASPKATMPATSKPTISKPTISGGDDDEDDDEDDERGEKREHGDDDEEDDD
jgi:hypothetical protein